MINEDFKGGYDNACKIVEAELDRLRHIGKITGDPNTYWKIMSIEKLETLLQENLKKLESGYLESDSVEN